MDWGKEQSHLDCLRQSARKSTPLLGVWKHLYRAHFVNCNPCANSCPIPPVRNLLPAHQFCIGIKACNPVSFWYRNWFIKDKVGAAAHWQQRKFDLILTYPSMVPMEVYRMLLHYSSRLVILCRSWGQILITTCAKSSLLSCWECPLHMKRLWNCLLRLCLHGHNLCLPPDLYCWPLKIIVYFDIKKICCKTNNQLERLNCLWS